MYTIPIIDDAVQACQLVMHQVIFSSSQDRCSTYQHCVNHKSCDEISFLSASDKDSCCSYMLQGKSQTVTCSRQPAKFCLTCPHCTQSASARQMADGCFDKEVGAQLHGVQGLVADRGGGVGLQPLLNGSPLICLPIPCQNDWIHHQCLHKRRRQPT